MSYPYPLQTFQQSITPQVDISGVLPNWDISGNPVFIPHATGIYFAMSAKGRFGSVFNNLNFYNIFVGSLDISGNVQWIDTFGTELQPDKNAWNPNILIGKDQEIYIVYTTDGAIYGGASSRYLDTVLARIDVIPRPRVIWKTQNTTTSSLFNDVEPVIAIDLKFNYIYLSNIQNWPLNPQITLRCLNTRDGDLLWTLIEPPIRFDYINNTGKNTQPSIVTDNNGSVYIAYLTSGNHNIYDGQIIKEIIHIPYVQVDIVKFKTIQLTPDIYDYEYVWTLSDTIRRELWANDGYSQAPKLAVSNNNLILSFLTSGSIQTHTESSIDLVVASIQYDGTLLWKIQGLPSYLPVTTIHSFELAADDIYIYISAVINSKQSYDTVLAWKLSNFDGTSMWYLKTQNFTEPAYIYASNNTILNPIVGDGGFSFRSSGIKVLNDTPFISVLTYRKIGLPSINDPPFWFTITKYTSRKYNLSVDSWQYFFPQS